MKRTITIVSLLLVLLISSTCFSQEEEFNPNWEVSMSVGQSFVDYYEEFGTEYNTGLTFNPEASYNFSRLFSASLSVYFTTVNSGNDKANVDRASSVEPSEGVSMASHYQTIIAPTIQFTPIHSKKHRIFVGIGPTYTFGKSLLSETISEPSTTLFKHMDGYLGSVGYIFSICRNWSIGGRYIYHKCKGKTEHLLLSLGYTIN